MSGFAVTSSRADGPLVLHGFAARTNQWYPIGGEVLEFLTPGCFKRSILDPNTDTVLNLEHGLGGSGLPLARTTAGTLKLSEITEGPETGLFLEAILDEGDPDAQLLQRKLASGALSGQASFAFRVNKNGQTWSDDYTRRRITEINMMHGDVTACTYGANDQTYVQIAPRAMVPVPDYTTTARRRYELLLSRQKG